MLVDTDLVVVENSCCATYYSILCLTIVGVGTWWFVMNYRSSRDRFVSRRAEKAERDRRQIEDVLTGSLSEDESNTKVMELDASELVARMQDGHLKIADVLSAYQKKAYQAHLETNCLSGVIEVDIDTISDELSRKNPASCILYGLPISLKENISIKGMDAPRGISRLIGVEAREDSVIARVMKHHGAIPFVKTTVPQMTASYESGNPIYGRTHNPLNHDLSPGGSSSGEGALIGSEGSVLGIGTDIAGSIRCPAHFCGICGFKPTSGRISKLGVASAMPGQKIIHSSMGPMARSMDTVTLGTRALFSPIMFQLDPSLPSIPFDEKTFSNKKKLRIGYYVDDGYQPAVPACKMAVEITRKKLLEAGHELIPFKVPDVENVMFNIFEGLLADSGQSWIPAFEGDHMCAPMKGFYDMISLNPLSRIIKNLMWKMRGERRLARYHYLAGGRKPDAVNLIRVLTFLDAYKDTFFGLWQKHNLDAIICPAHPVPACPQDICTQVIVSWNYNILYNMLDCPAGVVPVRKVTQQDIDQLDDYRGHYDDTFDKIIQTASRTSVGMPVAVQCVSSPFKDEVCLRLMTEIESLMTSQ